MTTTTRRAISVATAILAAAISWLAAAPLLGQELTVQPQGRPAMELGLVPVVLVSALAGLAGWALLALLERFVRRARTIWTVVAALVLLLSFAPLFDPSLATGTRVTLGLMHLAVGMVLIAGLPGRDRVRAGA